MDKTETPITCGIQVIYNIENNSTYYQQGALVISIKSECPAATHEQLLKAINAALKNSLVNLPDSIAEANAIAALADLQAALLPTEQQLNKIIHNTKTP